MDEYTACELAYKNGFAAGQASPTVDGEIATRIKVAYEQLGKVHTIMCRECTDRNDNELIYDVQDILNAILKVQVKLGMIKREEDIK